MRSFQLGLRNSHLNERNVEPVIPCEEMIKVVMAGSCRSRGPASTVRRQVGSMREHSPNDFGQVVRSPRRPEADGPSRSAGSVISRAISR